MQSHMGTHSSKNHRGDEAEHSSHAPRSFLTQALAAQIADAIRDRGFRVQGPDTDGTYATHTAVCHDGSAEFGLIFGPGIGARCPQSEDDLARLLARLGLTQDDVQEAGHSGDGPTSSLGDITVGFLWPRRNSNTPFPTTIQDTIPLGIPLDGVRTGGFRHGEHYIDLAERSKRVRDALPLGDLDAPENKKAKAAYTAAKAPFPGLLPQTSAPAETNRAGLSFQWDTGLYLFDLDKNLPPPGPELDAALKRIRESLSRHPSTVLVGLSVSGRALWALIRGPKVSDQEERDRAWQAMRDTIPGLEHAASGQCDLGRLRFLAHDPDAYINLDAVPFEPPAPDEQEKSSDPGRAGTTGDSDSGADAQEASAGAQDWTPPDEWLQDLARAIEGRGVKVKAPADPNGEFETSTLVCHGGDSERKLRFSIRGAHCFTRDCSPTWKTLAEWAGIPLWWEKGRNGDEGSQRRAKSKDGAGPRQRWARTGTQGPWQDNSGTPTPQVILPILPDQPPYPVPKAIEPFAKAVHELAGCSLPTAAMCALGSWNLLACEDRDVKGLAHMPFPTSLTLLVSSRSGGRKSNAFKLAYLGHTKADKEVLARWKAVREKRTEWEQSQGKSGNKASDDKGPPRARASQPWSMRSDITIQSYARRLFSGRPTQALATAEAGKLIGKGSWSFGGEQLHKTLSDLSDLFSEGSLGVDRVTEDVEFRFEHRRAPIMLLGQPGKMLPLVFSPAAGDGFTARSLISHDHVRPPEPEPYDWKDSSPAEVIEWWAKLTERRRAVQDEELEYAPGQEGVGKEPGPRPVLVIGDEATQMLRQFYQQGLRIADGEVSEHEESWWVRAPELAARVAATLTMTWWYRAADANKRAPRLAAVEAGTMADAIALVRWHGRELHRIAGLATAQQDAAAAQWVADNAPSCVDTEGIGQGKVEDGTAGAVRLLSFMGRRSAGKGHYLRGDPEARNRVLEILIDHGRTVPAGRPGWFFIQNLDPADEGYDPWGWDDECEDEC